MDGEIIELNVGGVFYTTTKSTLYDAEPGSMLAAIVKSGLPSRRDANGRVFIDRDGHRFRNVLNYLRSASFHCVDDRTALRELAEEAEFFGSLRNTSRTPLSKAQYLLTCTACLFMCFLRSGKAPEESAGGNMAH